MTCFVLSVLFGYISEGKLDDFLTEVSLQHILNTVSDLGENYLS